MSNSPQDQWPQQNPFGEKNPFADNPYATPAVPPGAGFGGPGTPVVNRGMVGHVPVIAILMMVQGGLELAAGLLFVAMGFIIPNAMKGEMHGPGAPPEWFFLALYGGMGLGGLFGGFLHIMAGIRNFKYRGRTLGLVALIGGMLSCSTCYCAPTTIALGVYGLVAYLNPPVVHAFTMGDAGESKPGILAAFGM